MHNFVSMRNSHLSEQSSAVSTAIKPLHFTGVAPIPISENLTIPLLLAVFTKARCIFLLSGTLIITDPLPVVLMEEMTNVKVDVKNIE